LKENSLLDASKKDCLDIKVQRNYKYLLMTVGSQKLHSYEELKDQAEFVMYGTIMLSYQNFFNPLNAKLNPICHLVALLGAHFIFHVSRIRVNYTDQIHNIYSLHIFTVFLLHVLVLQHHQGELCVLYFKPQAVMQLLYMVTAVVIL
jgi:hypothetical protein